LTVEKLKAEVGWNTPLRRLLLRSCLQKGRTHVVQIDFKEGGWPSRSIRQEGSRESMLPVTLWRAS
jgi:hypothetical protein